MQLEGLPVEMHIMEDELVLFSSFMKISFFREQRDESRRDKATHNQLRSLSISPRRATLSKTIGPVVRKRNNDERKHENE